MTVISKFEVVPTRCVEYAHPWTDSCFNASAGLLIASSLDSFRIYSAVYIVSKPSVKLQVTLLILILALPADAWSFPKIQRH